MASTDDSALSPEPGMFLAPSAAPRWDSFSSASSCAAENLGMTASRVCGVESGLDLGIAR
jgi:hypothetical protein